MQSCGDRTSHVLYSTRLRAAGKRVKTKHWIELNWIKFDKLQSSGCCFRPRGPAGCSHCTYPQAAGVHHILHWLHKHPLSSIVNALLQKPYVDGFPEPQSLCLWKQKKKSSRSLLFLLMLYERETKKKRKQGRSKKNMNLQSDLSTRSASHREQNALSLFNRTRTWMKSADNGNYAMEADCVKKNFVLFLSSVFKGPLHRVWARVTKIREFKYLLSIVQIVYLAATP